MVASSRIANSRSLAYQPGKLAANAGAVAVVAEGGHTGND